MMRLAFGPGSGPEICGSVPIVPPGIGLALQKRRIARKPSRSQIGRVEHSRGARSYLHCTPARVFSLWALKRFREFVHFRFWIAAMETAGETSRTTCQYTSFSPN